MTRDAVLHDAVTLRHFAAVGELDLLADHHGDRHPPRAAEEVIDEIRYAANKKNVAHCWDILNATWIGTPPTLTRDEAKQVSRIRRLMSPNAMKGRKNLGEAASIFLAERANGLFATDDDHAYDFACNRKSLGHARVIDTVAILRSAVSSGLISSAEADQIATQMEAADRHLRPTHSGQLDPQYFALPIAY